MGVTGPIVPFGVNFSSGIETLAVNQQRLSDVNPLKSLGNVTAPLDGVWKALGQRFNINSFDDLKRFLGGSSNTSTEPPKTALGGSFGLNGTSTTTGGMFGIAKSVFILTANILVIVLDLALKALKYILGLIT